MAETVEKNPLIQVYRVLDKSDFRRLGKWLDSPIHNNRDDVRALHAYFAGDPDRLYKTSALSKTRIWKRIFPQEMFDDARLRQTIHWALKAIKAFISYASWCEEPINQELSLTVGLRKRGLPQAMSRSLKRARQLLEAGTVRNEEYYRYKYQLELESEEYRTYYDQLNPPGFQRIADNLDVMYLIEKLKVSCNMLYQSRLSRIAFRFNFLEEVIELVKRYDLKAYPVLAIYYYVYRGFTEEDKEGSNISLLRDTLLENEELMTAIGVRYVILMAINICISKANRGFDAFVREMFEWYRLGIEKNVIAKNGQLTRATYLNVVNNALKLKEYDWTHDFIERYTHQLEEDIKENTEYFARARLGYELKDYNTAMPLLVQVDFKHPVYNILAKTLLLKIYYELDEFDALDSQVDSMTTYIRRKELSDLHRNNFNSVARLTRQLSRLNPFDKKKKEALRKRIEETSPLTEKKWLLEQLDKV